MHVKMRFIHVSCVYVQICATPREFPTKMSCIKQKKQNTNRSILMKVEKKRATILCFMNFLFVSVERKGWWPWKSEVWVAGSDAQKISCHDLPGDDNEPFQGLPTQPYITQNRSGRRRRDQSPKKSDSSSSSAWLFFLAPRLAFAPKFISLVFAMDFIVHAA